MGRRPDEADSDVDDADGDEQSPSKLQRFASADHDQGNSVGDNLREELGLQGP